MSAPATNNRALHPRRRKRRGIRALRRRTRPPGHVLLATAILFLGVLGVVLGAGWAVLLTSRASSSVDSGVPPTVRRLVVEAGILPTSPWAPLDRWAEVADRTVFSLGLPSMRVSVLLHQAGERIAEMRELERNGALSAEALLALADAHGELTAGASEVVKRRLAAGRSSPDLVLRLVRSRLASAAVLEEELEEFGEWLALSEPEPAGRPNAVPSPQSRLRLAVDHLVTVEEDILPAGLPVTVLPPEAVRELAADRVERAERDLELIRSGRGPHWGGQSACPSPTDIGRGQALVVATHALHTARAALAAEDFPRALLTARNARCALRCPTCGASPLP